MKNSGSAIGEMTGNLLFEHFATLATAPEGIALLRELILQLAVQGKLGTQDPGDEPASTLLKKINAEKRQLIKDGKIRQEQPLTPIENNGLQNNLPDKWCLSKLGGYCLVIMGQSPESKYYNEHGSGLPFYQGKSEFGKLFPKPKVWCENPLKIAQKNDILISVRAPVGPTNICPSESCIGRGLTALRSLSGTSHFFLLYSLRAYEKIISEMGVGSTFSAISKKDLDNFVLAVPPLAEQHRIVAKIDRLMALCDELEARQQKERAGCLKLGTASLAGLQKAASPDEFERQWAQVCDAFEMILDCPENVAVLRQMILQLAVQGWLVRQEPGDEAAEKLLEKIRKEKERLIKEGTVKKEKPLESINEEEYPFALPDGWVWVRINEAAKLVEYGTSEKALSSPNAYGINSVPVFRMNNIQNGKVSHEDLKYISNSIEELPHLYLQKNDILINRTNSYELVGKAGIFKGDDNKFTFASYLIRISFFPQFVNADYINTALNAGYFRKSQIEPQVTQQCGQANFSGSKIKNAIIPLPPLAEQHRIVAKVDALMALCDALESRLKERAGVQERFAKAVGKQVAG